MKKIGNQFYQRALVVNLILFSFAFAFAADTEVSAFIDRERMGQNDTLIYTISVSSSKSVNVDKVINPEWSSDFEVINSWNGSEFSSTMSNGSFETIRTKKFNYQLQPKRRGTLNFTPAKVIIDGRTYNTDKLKVQVLKGSLRTRQRPTRRGINPFQQLDQLFDGFVRPKRIAPDQIIDPKEAIFIRAEVDKKSVYVGEKINVSFYIYVQGDLRDLDTLKYPSLEGFWKEDISITSRLSFSRASFRGKFYKKALLVTYALFPLKAGISYIGSYETKTNLYIYNRRPIIQIRKSPRVAIKVKKLPKPIPSDFTGGVGRFDVSSRIDRDKIEVNQPLLLSLLVKGSGNAKFIEIPKIEYPEGFQVYSSQESADFFPKELLSQKKAEILVTANQEGSFEIPETTMSFLDPKLKKYYTKKLASQRIEVYRGKNQSKDSSANFMGSSDSDKNNGQRSFYPSLISRWEVPQSKESLKFSFILIGALFLVIGFLIFKVLKITIFVNKTHSLEKALQTRMNKLDALLMKKRWREVGVEAINAIYWVLGEASDQGKASEKIDKLLMSLPPSLRRDSEQEIRKLLEIFEALSFAPDDVVKSIVSDKQVLQQVVILKSFSQKCIKLNLGKDA